MTSLYFYNSIQVLISLSGILFQELVHNFKSFNVGKESYKLRLYVAHDGSMIRLAAGLGFGKNGPLRWPAMGSEIALEVCFYLFRRQLQILIGLSAGRFGAREGTKTL